MINTITEAKALEFQNLTINEQLAEFGSIFNLKINKRDFKEIEKYNLYTLLTDEQIQNNIKNEKIKTLLKNIKNIATIFSYTKLADGEKLSSPVEVVDFLKTILKSANEKMIAIYLSANNKVIHYEIVSEGTNARSAIYPSKIAKIALLKSARSVIIAHNHPAGTLKPSQNDIIATEAVQKGLKTVEVVLLDSIIVTDNDYYSFKDNGLI